MKSLKNIIPTLFEKDEIDRVDYYIDKIRDSLKTTNRLFITFTSLLLLSILSYHLFISGNLQEINVLGFKVSDIVLIKRWFLIIPSSIFFTSTLIGYLRIYQIETIEWLIAKHRKKEFESELFRLTFPSSFILGADLIRKQENKKIKYFATIPSTLLIMASIVFPVIYIDYAYFNVFKELSQDIQSIISCLISNLLIICAFVIIGLSQKI